jgi:GNAT superfamily N-acetyltransferase
VSLTIRRAGAQDVGAVLTFVRALAAYEGDPAAVVGTEADLEATLFSDRPGAFCELAEWNGIPAGFALWHHSYSVFLGCDCLWLEDLYIDERYRRLGIGHALFVHLAARCVSDGLGRLEWSVLKDNEMAMSFYAKLNARFDDGRIKCRLTKAQIARLAEGLTTDHRADR